MATLHLVREDPSRLHFAHRPFVGVLLVLVGAALAYFGALHLDDRFGRWLAVGSGGFFALIGVGATLWRHELTCDLLARTYRARRGFWPSIRTFHGSLDELDGVVLRRERRRSSSTQGASTEYDAWVVALEFPQWNLSIFESRDETKARSRLEHLARLMRTAAVDRTGDEEVRRAWDELDHSLAERARRHGGSSNAPADSPPGGRIDWNPTHGAATIVLPPLGFSVATLLVMLAGALFAGFGGAALAALSGLWKVPVSGSRAVGWLLGTIFLAIGAWLTLGAVWASRAREIVQTRRDGLQFSLTWLGRHYRRRFLPRREIEEVACRPVSAAGGGRSGATPREVVVRSDTRLVRLGSGLTDDEQAWLVDALTYLVTR